MNPKVENLEEKLNSLLFQLQTESGILDRIVYKGKNQHRHGLYFQYLSKVRRDLRLLLSIGLGDILSFLFQILNGSKPTQMLYLLERLKKKKNYSRKHNFLERLLGAARLLSEMVEPILKAAVQVSCLLARSFFTGFSLAVLALLARLRVLVQQILLDVVSVFNAVSSLSQKQHSVKLTKEGAEIFREYYPSSGEIPVLECVLEGDKFVLLEKTCLYKAEKISAEEATSSMGASAIQYHSLEALNEGSTNVERSDASSPAHQSLKKAVSMVEDHFHNGGSLDTCNTRGGGLVANENQYLIPVSQSPIEPRKMAFIQVRKPTLLEKSENPLPKRVRTDQLLTSDVDNKDPYYSLFTGEIVQDTIL